MQAIAFKPNMSEDPEALEGVEAEDVALTDAPEEGVSEADVDAPEGEDGADGALAAALIKDLMNSDGDEE